MRERILHILSRFRRRLLAVRAAEAAAVAGAAGALAAAFLMAGRILADRHPAAGAAVCAAPLAAGAVLAAWGRARRAISAASFLQWFVVILLAGCGTAALAALAAGGLAAVPKNVLFLIAPASALLAAGIALVRPVRLDAVAVLLDQRAALAERLSTAWELQEGRQESAFARAVREQAAAAAEQGDLSRIRLWNRTPATLGALGLALVAAALMLPWRPLESPAARRARLWRQVAPQVAEALDLQLPALSADLAAVKELEPQLRRLEAVTRLLRSAKPGEAAQWEGKVVELDRIAAALREIARSGRADRTATRRIERLLAAIERASSDIAEAMAQAGGAELARAGAPAIEPDELTPATTRESELKEWATVFDPRYADLVEPATATAPAAGPEAAQPPPAPQIPYDEKWAAAQARAAKALGAEPIPAQYRQLIRDFFAPAE